MSVRITQPSYIYAPAGQSLLEHLRVVAWTVDQLMELNGGTEPSRITSDWRDDGPGEHNGWMSIIEWPLQVAK